jgi:hypothetical protein
MTACEFCTRSMSYFFLPCNNFTEVLRRPNTKSYGILYFFFLNLVETPPKPCVAKLHSVGDGGNEEAGDEAESRSSSGPWSISRHSGTGYLVGGSSGISLGISPAGDDVLSDCATERSPVRLTARIGQRLNITVYEFGYGHYLTKPSSGDHLSSAAAAGSSSSSSSGAAAPSSSSLSASQQPSEVECVVVSEPDTRRRMNLCPRARRMRTEVYVSLNNSVEIYFKRVGAGGLGSMPMPHHLTHKQQQQQQQHQQVSQQLVLDDRRFLVQFTGTALSYLFFVYNIVRCCLNFNCFSFSTEITSFFVVCTVAVPKQLPVVYHNGST